METDDAPESGHSSHTPRRRRLLAFLGRALAALVALAVGIVVLVDGPPAGPPHSDGTGPRR